MQCQHDLTEREVAVTADGMCPLCQASTLAQREREIAELSSARYLEQQRADGWRDKYNADTDELAALKAEVERLQANWTAARELLLKCVTTGYSRHELNCFLSDTADEAPAQSTAGGNPRVRTP